MKRMLNMAVWSVACASLIAVGTSTMSAQTVSDRTGATSVSRPVVIRDHIEAAEDIVGDMLYMQHVPTNLPGDHDVARQSTTLINVDAQSIQKLRGVLQSIVEGLPGRTNDVRPRGDLRAHAEKAVEIARELGSGGPAAVGTSGRDADRITTEHGSDVVTIDRTALQRLEVEIDAMKLLQPRS